MEYLPQQRVSDSQKLKEEWYKPTLDYWIAKCESCNDKNTTRSNIEAANGEVDAETYKYVLQPISSEELKGKELPGKIRNVDFLTPIKEKNIGEYMELPYKFFVTVNNVDSVLKRNSELKVQLIKVLEQRLFQMMEGGQLDEEFNLEEYVENFKKKWMDNRAINGQNMLKLINDLNDFDNQRIQGFFNWWATEEFYTYRYIQDDELYKEIIDPMEGYPYDNNEQFIEDVDAFLIRRYITFQQFLERYRKILDKEKIEYIEEQTRKFGIDSNASVVYFLNERNQMDIWQGSIDNFPYDKRKIINPAQEIEENIVIFKTQTKKRILKTMNQLGEIVEMEVGDDYKLDKEAGDISIETDWIPEVWKGVRFGSNEQPVVYQPPEPEPIQRYNSKGHVKLPVGGKKGLLKGNYINPIPRRLIPYVAMDRIINLHQERTMAKYKGDIMAIPESAMNAGDGMTSKERYFYMLADNTLMYDDSVITPQEISYGFKVISNNGLREYLISLIELRKVLKEEAWDLANMNDYRYGDIRPDAGKGITEQSIYRAKLGSILMVQMYNQALAKDHMADLEYARYVYGNGKQGSILNEYNEPEFLDVDGQLLATSDLGVFVKNSQLEMQKYEQYKQLAFSAAQNGDFDMAAAAIDSDNIPSIRKVIEEFTNKRRAFEENMEKMKQAAEARRIQLQQQADERRYQHEMDKVYLEETLQTDREVLLEQIKERQEKDEGIDDLIKLRKQQIEERKQFLEERKQAFQENQSREENKIKQQQMKNDLKIARTNKN